jgi:hypothetical protein
MIEELELADLPQDFEWVVSGFPGTPAARGPEGPLAFFRAWIDQGGPDAILVLRDGVPVHMVFYTDAEEARRAAGIASPQPEP